MKQSNKDWTEQQIKLHNENLEYIEYHEYYDLDISFMKKFELENKVFKISYGNLYYHLNINSSDLVSIDVSSAIKNSLRNHFKFLIPKKQELNLVQKVWFDKSEYDKLTFYLTQNNLKQEIPFSCVLIAFMLDYGFGDKLESKSFEFQLHKMHKLIVDKYIINSRDGEYFRPSEYEIESLNIRFTDKKIHGAREMISIDKLKLSKQRKLNEAQFLKFQNSLKKSLLKVVKENISDIQIQSTKNSNIQMASTFYRFIKRMYPEMEDASICRIFLFLFINSNQDLNDPGTKNTEISSRIEANINKVRRWMKF